MRSSLKSKFCLNFLKLWKKILLIFFGKNIRKNCNILCQNEDSGEGQSRVLRKISKKWSILSLTGHWGNLWTYLGHIGLTGVNWRRTGCYVGTHWGYLIFRVHLRSGVIENVWEIVYVREWHPMGASWQTTCCPPLHCWSHCNYHLRSFFPISYWNFYLGDKAVSPYISPADFCCEGPLPVFSFLFSMGI